MIDLDIRGISSDCTEYGTVTTDCVTVGRFITEMCGKYPDSELTFRTEEGMEIIFNGERNVEVRDFALLDSVTWAGGYGRYTFIIKTKPKPKTVKKSGWVNLYRTELGNYCIIGKVYGMENECYTDPTRKETIINAEFVTTAKIEWEEAQQ